MLQDLVHLVLTALPTTFFLIVLWIYFQKVVFGPLDRVLAERHEATAGAVESAQRALSAAESKAVEYETALRAARGEILRAQEAERQKLRRQQSEQLQQARLQSAEQLEAARQRIARESEAARVGLRAETERLAAEIEQAVLRGSRA